MHALPPGHAWLLPPPPAPPLAFCCQLTVYWLLNASSERGVQQYQKRFSDYKKSCKPYLQTICHPTASHASQLLYCKSYSHCAFFNWGTCIIFFILPAEPCEAEGGRSKAQGKPVEVQTQGLQLHQLLIGPAPQKPTQSCSVLKML